MDERQPAETHNANTEASDTVHEQETARRRAQAPGSLIAKRVIYYIGSIIIALLAIRLILQLLGANEGNGFVDFIYAVTTPLILPFYGIFGEPTYGQSQFETAALVAIIIYGLVTIGIAKLFNLTKPPQENI